MKFILKKMKKKFNRKATFVCSLSYKTKFGKIITAEGRINGKISDKIVGKKLADVYVQPLVDKLEKEKK